MFLGCLQWAKPPVVPPAIPLSPSWNFQALRAGPNTDPTGQPAGAGGVPTQKSAACDGAAKSSPRQLQTSRHHHHISQSWRLVIGGVSFHSFIFPSNELTVQKSFPKPPFRK